MLRTTIMLPEELKRKAMQAAAQRGMSLGELIRESLQRACVSKPEEIDPFFADDHTFEGETPTDIALKHDDYLDEGDK